MKRCIMIFPEFGNMKIIDEIREKYDPLTHNVRPHITLVFPFESEIEEKELKEHITSCLSDIQSFGLTLRGIIPMKSHGNYLFLNIDSGRDNVIDVHKRLYTGILEKYKPLWLREGEFYPHMTVGRIDNEDEFDIATEEVRRIEDRFDTVVKKVSVEIIDENEDSKIEIEVGLR